MFRPESACSEKVHGKRLRSGVFKEASEPGMGLEIGSELADASTYHFFADRLTFAT